MCVVCVVRVVCVVCVVCVCVSGGRRGGTCVRDSYTLLDCILARGAGHDSKSQRLLVLDCLSWKVCKCVGVCVYAYVYLFV